MPHSNIKEDVAKVLVRKGFVVSAKAAKPEKGDDYKMLSVVLNLPDTNSPISHLARLSKPGRRLYAQADKIPVVKYGRGIVVVSTSQGVMSGD